MSDEPSPTVRRAQQNWLLSVLPAFPLVLLVLRLWYLSRQDLPTMLLLVQYVSPLGMISALVITLIWTVPAVVLVLRVLGGLLLISARDPLDAGRSLLAVITWQLRFLPVLLMLLVSILGVTAWQRHPGDRTVLRIVTVGVPFAAALAAYLWIWPGLVSAVVHREPSTFALLAAPPLLGLLLTGPVPTRYARLATHWPAVLAAMVAPFVVGAVFLRAPILPTAAVEYAPASGPHEVLRGQIITVDDTMTTVLDLQGEVQFVPNSQVRSKTLCPDTAQVPSSDVTVRGWPVEGSVLEWVAPTRRVAETDQRCAGRSSAPG